jgi:bacillithiol biosynthesis deacetylase BshB2
MVPAAVEAALQGLLGRAVFLHLETTAGAYTEGGFGAFVRNARVHLRRAAIRGGGPYRAGLEIDEGWVYAEGLTDWEVDAEGRVLMAGHDAQGRVTVVCELGERPFPAQGRPARLRPEPAAPPAGQAAAGPPTAERAVLFVHAHPDDETFGCGGTIALYTRAGVPVTVAIATGGEMGRNMGKPPFATRESLRDLREHELEAACAILGVRDVRLLGVWDKTTEFADPAALAARVGALIAELHPSLVLTSHPEHGRHPDHCAVAAATLEAVRQLAPGARPRVHAMIPGVAAERLGVDVHAIDIRPVMDIKEKAVLAHRSQSEAGWRDLTAEELERRRQRFHTERYVVLEPGSP